ncbi:MAG: glycerol-3-phosphate 1-O-acyltransferase PlsY [Oscillospiraceae bacterium]|jgi:glycerol-3-phosphate acyltransferase PlsY|nr:glycerol-3-phosphate 1-O-acyltransferase PlsY [Oscillospiraceae bacterium]
MFNDFFAFVLSDWVFLLIFMVFSYLIGSVNFSIIFSKILVRKDIRTLGSKNAGFTNVARSLGAFPAILTFIGDFLKGVIAVALGTLFSNLVGLNSKDSFYLKLFMMFSCLLGHLYPCFFKFKGGKGILTAWSMNLLVDWRLFLVLISVFLIVLAVSKIVSLASISVSFFYPFLTFLFFSWSNNLAIHAGVATFFSSLAGAMIILRHKDNIKRILMCEEKPIKKRFDR